MVIVQGKFDYDGAEKLYERALRINTAKFGEEHPEVAENINGYFPSSSSSSSSSSSPLPLPLPFLRL